MLIRGSTLTLGGFAGLPAVASVKVPAMGMLVAGPLSVIFAAFADKDTRLAEITIFGIVMTLLSGLLFKELLGLPIRPDEALLRAAGVNLNEVLIPDYDQETYQTNVPGLYIAGSVACGCETWNIFIENGRAHADPIIRHIRLTLGEARG
jgi:hypothetical protein